MKRIFTRALWLVIGFSPLSLFAQTPPPLPLDPDVRYGKLENGLTYYIQHNDLPADRAEFYIVQKVGSIQEEDSQLGLAHFLEHMAFNGTKNFPGKSMLNYLEANGVKFGANVNAYTSIDETVYNLSKVPTTNQNLVDSCLLILHDWSGFISLEDEEIDAERGVIKEEWRTRQNPFLRMYENTILPDLYPNNRYGVRMPIGSMEVVENFPYKVLRDYYHTWYRPDLQAVIVVGDIDVDRTEAEIKKLWQDIPAPVNPKERVYYPVEDNVETIVTVDSDKELSQNILSVMFKREPLPMEFNNTAVGLMMDYINSMIGSMLNMRYVELTQKSDAPFLQAYAQYDQYMLSQTKDAMGFTIVFKDGEWKRGLNEMMAVANSAKEYGFNGSEFERAKAELKSYVENIYNERDKQDNSDIVQTYVQHFLKNKAAMAIDAEYQFFNQFIENISLEQVNQLMRSYITPENIAIMLMGIEKEGADIPTKEELLVAFNEANAIEPVAYVDEMSNKPLITEAPKAGTIVKEAKGPHGSTEWTLSNGATVIYKPTDFKTDEVMLYAFSPGGKSHLDKADMKEAKVINDVISLGGVGEFSATDLTKVLSGKRVSISPFIGTLTEGFEGRSTPKDLETLMQLTYLSFTAPREDTEAFQAWKTRTKSMLANYASNPQVVFSDSLTATMYNHNEEKARLHEEDIDMIDYGRIMEIQKERFANAGDFTFIFVGNVSPEQLRPLVELYIASIPECGKPEKLQFKEPRVAAGDITNRFNIPMATPKTTVYNIFTGKIKDNVENTIAMDMLSQIMGIVYTETVREKEGGTYGVSARGQIKKDPKGEFIFMYGFDTSDAKRDRLEQVAYDELVRVANDGPQQDDFDKVKEYMLKRRTEQLKENGFWQGALISESLFGESDVNDYSKEVEKITPKDIQNLAKKIVKSGNRIQVVSTGVEQK